ncbi:MAG: anti-sigma factor [Pseudonocardiales bacterium]|nr:anti-sigma factor [Pseudonocardiales bacterium]MBV9728560.1 anti-sigma factor [Pseudonocardiales bacterium]
MNDQHHVADCPHRELAVGWALHALEPAEESLVAAHMPECPTCTSTAAETDEIGAMLGLSVPEAVPSAELEQRVLSVTGARWAAPVGPRAPSAPPARHITKPSWLRISELTAAAAVILVAAAVVLGVRVVQLSGELNQAERQAAAMSEAIQSAADPAAVRVPLIAKDGGVVVGMVLASRDRVAVVPTRLPSNRVEDQTYVLWGLTGGAPIALAAFDVASQAPRLHAVPSATETGKFTGYAVSLEPGRRAPAAPTDVVATSR